MKPMSSEQRQAFNRVAHIYAEAAGVPAGAAVEKLEKEPALIGGIAKSLRDMAGVSPLADELDKLFPAAPAPVANNTPKEAAVK